MDTVKGKGLPNLDRTCYLNAACQLLLQSGNVVALLASSFRTLVPAAQETGHLTALLQHLQFKLSTDATRVDSTASMSALVERLELSIGDDHDMDEILYRLCTDLPSVKTFREQCLEFTFTQVVGTSSVSPCLCSDNNGAHVKQEVAGGMIYWSQLSRACGGHDFDLAQMRTEFGNSDTIVHLDRDNTWKYETCHIQWQQQRLERERATLGMQLYWRVRNLAAECDRHIWILLRPLSSAFLAHNPNLRGAVP